MENGTLFLIPARGGSKGIPGKNIKLLNNRPLIQYTIDAARQIANDDDICVSTDSIEIKKVVESIGLKVPFLRPSDLAGDNSSSESVIRHALAYYESVGEQYKNVVFLQPTSPFRSYRHILEAMKLMTSSLDMTVSVKETSANPYYVLFEENQNGYLQKCKQGQFNTRQDCPKVYELNGAIYVINVSSLKQKGMQGFDQVTKYEMGELDSVDIDTPLDWMVAEQIFKNKMI